MRIGICARTIGEQGGIGVYTRSLLEAMLSLESAHDYLLFYDDRSHIGRFGGQRECEGNCRARI